MDRLSTPWMLVRAGALVVLVVVESLALQASDPGRRLVANAQVAFARSASLFLGLTGLEHRLDGTRIGTARGSVEVTDDCVGLDVGLFLGSAMLVYPAPLGRKLAGFGASLGIVMALNWVRVVTLAWLAQGPRSLFDVFHVYLWPGILIATCVGVFLLWIRALPPAGEPRAPAP